MPVRAYIHCYALNCHNNSISYSLPSSAPHLEMSVDPLPLCLDAAIAAVKNPALSPSEVADKVVEQCSIFLKDNTHTDSYKDDTPGLEAFLWDFWSSFLDLAKDDAAIHDQLAQILSALQAKGADGCDGWRVWEESFSWGDVPLFRPVSREEMNGTIVLLRSSNLK